MDPFVDLDYARVNVPCPRCGAKLDADEVAGYFLRCRDRLCNWKGSILDVGVRRAESKLLEA